MFFNDTFEALNFAAGTLRIRIDGHTAPSLYLNHYAQLYLRPGKYELLLEHWDLFQFTDVYEIEVDGEEAFFQIWATPIGNAYRRVPELPAGFRSRFTGGRDMSEWPPFVPE